MNTEVKTSHRIIAYLLDILLVYIIISFLVSIRFINPYYDEYLEAYNKYSEILTKEENDVNKIVDTAKDYFYDINKYGIVYNIASCAVIILYYGLFQKYNNGQTLGKKIMKIKVVDNKSNENPSLIKYFLRILPLQYIYIGSFLPMLLNAILVLFLNHTLYLYSYTLIMTIFMIITIINICFIAFRKDHRGLHDLLASTKVVYE